AYSDLESVDRQREEFLAFIAHEVRHPVAAISTIAETLADTPGLGAREQRALDGLRGQARLLTRLAEEVLAVARVETQGVRPRRSEVDVGALLDALGRQAPDPERVHLARPSRRVRIEADPELLGHAFDNLMRNALKYSPPGSPVGISLSSARGSLRIAVRDHGVGLAPDEIPRLFKKYGRIHNDRTAQTAGVGLGLYLSRLLIEAHGGSITAESAGLGEGSTFTVVLPNEPANPDVRP
ncbi:MAG: sensor histidine kinase, partial [Candidatus Dormibacteraceae bacterium]